MTYDHPQHRVNSLQYIIYACVKEQRLESSTINNNKNSKYKHQKHIEKDLIYQKITTIN